MKTKTSKINLLICGSQNFEDKAFVFGMLNQLNAQTQHGITDIFTSNFAGACKYARDWIELSNIDSGNSDIIKHHECTFDMHIGNNNISFYEEADLPQIIIQNDPFFKKGKELLIENGINMICSFPNSLGIMGAATRNIQRFAELGGIPFLNGVEAYHLLKDLRSKAEVVQEDSFGLKNQHGMKK